MKKVFKLSLGLMLTLGLLVSCEAKVATTGALVYKRPEVKSPDDAINVLKEGNERMLSQKVLSKDLTKDNRDQLSKNGQNPIAVVLSCSDSRVPPEIVFDQGIGDIFAIRNAGNVIEQASLGSIEYGTYKLNAPLVVVLGHEKCGAVEATVKGLDTNTDIDYIINKIKPVYTKIKSSSSNKDITTKTEDENIKYQIEKIKESKTIQKLINNNKLKVVGAKYDLDTGKVVFLDK